LSRASRRGSAGRASPARAPPREHLLRRARRPLERPRLPSSRAVSESSRRTERCSSGPPTAASTPLAERCRLVVSARSRARCSPPGPTAARASGELLAALLDVADRRSLRSFCCCCRVWSAWPATSSTAPKGPEARAPAGRRPAARSAGPPGDHVGDHLAQQAGAAQHHLGVRGDLVAPVDLQVTSTRRRAVERLGAPMYTPRISPVAAPDARALGTWATSLVRRGGGGSVS
jgi:hypothetical protein